MQQDDAAAVNSEPRELFTPQQFCDAFKFKRLAGLRSEILNAEDRLSSRGERIAGNGLARHGAVLRLGRRVLIDPAAYFRWLAGQQQQRNGKAEL